MECMCPSRTFKNLMKMVQLLSIESGYANLTPKDIDKNIVFILFIIMF